MSSLLDLLTQRQPQFQTHQALVIIGLQNDFVSQDGKLPVTHPPGLVDRIKSLVPVFRESAGDVIWVRTAFEAERAVNDGSDDQPDRDTVVTGEVDQVGGDGSDEDSDDVSSTVLATTSRSERSRNRAMDLIKRISARKRTARSKAPPLPPDEEELFLSRTSSREPCCLPGSRGADLIDDVKQLMDQNADVVVTKSHYSALNSTTLLLILRTRLITELYICGCMTNISVYATALDAARHGLAINLIDDCLGYRKSSRHADAMKQMIELMGASVTSSAEMLSELSKHPDDEAAIEESGPTDDVRQDTDALEKMVEEMKLEDKSSTAAVRGPEGDRRGPEVSSKDRKGRSNPKKREKQGHGTLYRIPQGREDVKENAVIKSKSQLRMRPRKASPMDIPPQPSAEAGEPASLKGQPNPQKKEKDALEAEQTTRSGSGTNLATESRINEEPSCQPELQKGSSQETEPTSATPKTGDARRTQAPHPGVRSSSKSTVPASDSFKDQRTSERPRSHQTPRIRTSTGYATSTMAKQELSQDIESQDEGDSITSSSISNGRRRGSKLQSLATFPTLGPGDKIGEGDCHVVHDLIPSTETDFVEQRKTLRDTIFERLYNEVRWQKMYHAEGEVPRLVCVQGSFDRDGAMPVYRHPADQSLPLMHFSPAVQLVRQRVQRVVKHQVNHVLIQLYRTGNDYISEHSDKTLDIVQGSKIVNVSFGAQRTMRLRTKKSAASSGPNPEIRDDNMTLRNTQRIHMPHNSMFIMGLETNERWLHGIQPDRRRAQDRSPPELAFSGMRISLTFRHIGTFLSASSLEIWGQGATGKTRQSSCSVVNGDDEVTGAMIHAFGVENQSSTFDWSGVYGIGFNVLHFREPPLEAPLLFAGSRHVDTLRVSIWLKDRGVNFSLPEQPKLAEEYAYANRPIEFRDVDKWHSQICGVVPILIYLDRFHPFAEGSDVGPGDWRREAGAVYEVLLRSEDVLRKWIDARLELLEQTIEPEESEFVDVLRGLESLFSTRGCRFVGGEYFSIADSALWPVVDDVARNWSGFTRSRFPELVKWRSTVWHERGAVREVVRDWKEVAP
ncbi:hypothetical protein BDY21DRAFT_340634 [Lineolata rhizophorae]|uniref:Fe2OG dioxygenase domain-containing protein n=1 Tax=Lineolata rhizophorae TaxID=578093 RepID=A0A6A6P473_9PEZI|nr:hypothetical protein BDY21DRAFT_340634 [Lineolata rhizophorae]